ncbi:MAG: carbamoyltransferase N-terminal domain-containing protein, partial [Candidatus Acidiferrales bacterium]
MYILGLSAFGHDPAAALVGEQGVVAAIEEGKLARSRSFGGIPREAIRFCLDRAGIDWRDLDSVAIAGRIGRAWMRKALFRARLAPLSPVSSGYYFNKAFGELGRELNNSRILREMAGGRKDRIEVFDHHLSHAASAYYASSFDRALIVALDEQGDGQSGFVGIGEGSRIRKIASISFPHSLAWVFTQITKLFGFHTHADEHKTQWMSLSGEPVHANLFLEMLRRSPKGPPRLNAQYFQRSFAGELSFTDEFYRRLGIPRSSWPQPSGPQLDDPQRASIAASLQRACAVVLNEWFESLRNQTGLHSLCLAGGLFLNPLLVAAVEKGAGFDQIFVQPAAGNE